LCEFNKILLKKIEELTLHAIETKKHIQQQDKEIQTLKELINNKSPQETNKFIHWYAMNTQQSKDSKPFWAPWISIEP